MNVGDGSRQMQRIKEKGVETRTAFKTWLGSGRVGETLAPLRDRHRLTSTPAGRFEFEQPTPPAGDRERCRQTLSNLVLQYC